MEETKGKIKGTFYFTRDQYYTKRAIFFDLLGNFLGKSQYITCWSHQTIHLHEKLGHPFRGR